MTNEELIRLLQTFPPNAQCDFNATPRYDDDMGYGPIREEDITLSNDGDRIIFDSTHL